jgi:hypothetical protein
MGEMTRAQGRNQAKQHGAKRRKGSKYFVANPDDVRFGKRIPPTCHYRGRQPEGHLFTVKGEPYSGYLLSDSQVGDLVEPFTKSRETEVIAEANHYNETGKLFGER